MSDLINDALFGLIHCYDEGIRYNMLYLIFKELQYLGGLRNIEMR